MILDILIYPDKRLKTVCTEVTDFGDDFQKTIEDMFETMYAAPGIGLAAIQVGIFKRFLVMDVGIVEGETVHPDPKVLVNPKIVSKSGEIVWEEGCLSCPTLVVPMIRAQTIHIQALDRFGKPQSFEAQDLMAVCIQHEIDHLDGLLIADRLSRLDQEFYTKKLKSLEKQQGRDSEATLRRPIVR